MSGREVKIKRMDRHEKNDYSLYNAVTDNRV